MVLCPGLMAGAFAYYIIRGVYMKKSKLIIFIMAMVLGVFFVIPVRASAGEFDNYWDGSTSAKSYYDFDGKGVRFCF